MVRLFQAAIVTTMTRRDIITWVGRVSDTEMAGADVHLGYTRLDTATPRSLTAVGQRRDTTVATRATSATGRGATTTTSGTGRTAEFIIVVCISPYSTETNIISTR